MRPHNTPFDDATPVTLTPGCLVTARRSRTVDLCPMTVKNGMQLNHSWPQRAAQNLLLLSINPFAPMWAWTGITPSEPITIYYGAFVGNLARSLFCMFIIQWWPMILCYVISISPVKMDSDKKKYFFWERNIL